MAYIRGCVEGSLLLQDVREIQRSLGYLTSKISMKILIIIFYTFKKCNTNIIWNFPCKVLGLSWVYTYMPISLILRKVKQENYTHHTHTHSTLYELRCNSWCFTCTKPWVQFSLSLKLLDVQSWGWDGSVGKGGCCSLMTWALLLRTTVGEQIPTSCLIQTSTQGHGIHVQK